MNKPTPKQTPNNASFTVYMSVKLMAQVLTKANAHGRTSTNPSASSLIREVLEAFAGPEDEWIFDDSDAAISYMENQGFCLKQFSAPNSRWYRGKGREDLFKETEQAPTSDEVRKQELIEKFLNGDLTKDEIAEWRALSA
jgi:hypothetical protein